MNIYETILEAFGTRSYVSVWKSTLDNKPWPTFVIESGSARVNLNPSVEQLRKLANDFLTVAGEVEKAQMEANK